jgi:transposase
MKIEELLDLPFVKISNIKVNEDEVLFEVECTNKASNCPTCNNICESVHGIKVKKVKDRHLLDRKCWIIVHHRRFKCHNCNDTFMERLSWLDTNGRHTVRYAEWIKRLGREIDVKNLSELEGVGYKTVENIIKNNNHEFLFPDKNSFPIHAGIDEFAMKKGRGNFCVIINDNDKSKPYEILPSKENKTLISYFRSIPSKIRNKVKSFTIDMWKGGINIIQHFFPNCKITIDRFHVMSCLNKRIDKTRRRLQKLIKKEDSKKLKNLRWIMLKNGEDLVEEEKQKLRFAFERSHELEKIYDLKENVRKVFEMKISKEEARVKLRELIDDANLEIPHRSIKSFIKTYNLHEEYILNYFDERRSNGIIEGMINKIKAIKRKAFGMTNFYNFSGRIHQAFSCNHSPV